MLSFGRWFSKEGEYAKIMANGAIHPELADKAIAALRSGSFEDRGTRDDGALILVTYSDPALLIIGKVTSDAGQKPDFCILHVGKVEGAHKHNEVPQPDLSGT